MMRSAFYLVIIIVLVGISCSSTSTNNAKAESVNTALQDASNEIALGEKYDVKLKLEKNKTYTQNCLSKTSIYQTMSSQQVTMAVTVETKMSYKVLDVLADGYQMEVRYEKLSMTMAMQQTELLYTTGSNEKDYLSRSLDELRNKTFTIKMSNIGKVLEIKGIGSLIDAIVQSKSELDEQKKKQLRSQLMQAYGESTLKGNIELCSAVFPSGKVAKGEHWAVSTQLGSAMAPIVESDLELRDLTEKYYHVYGNSKISTQGKDVYAAMNGVNMSYNMKGNMTSDIKLDRITGWISSAKFSQFISGEAYVKGDDKSMQDMTIPMTANTEVTITE